MALVPIKQFVSEWLGKHVEAGGAPQNQCVDEINQYFDESGLPKILNANAVDFPNRVGPDWEFIQNGADNFPSPGDPVVWGNPYGKYTDDAGVVHYAGHIAICTDDVAPTSRGFHSMDQNWNVGQVCTIINHGYAGVIGWLHYKGGSMPGAVMYGTPNQYDLNNNESMKVAVDKLNQVLTGVYILKSDSDKAVADKQTQMQGQVNDAVNAKNVLQAGRLKVTQQLSLPDAASDTDIINAIQKLQLQTPTPNQPTEGPVQVVTFKDGSKWELNGINIVDGKYQANYKRA